MAEAPAGGAGGAAGAKQDPQALIAKHAAVTQAGAQGDQAIVTRVENAIKNSPMGWLQGVLGETSSRASSEQSQVSGKLAEHKDLVANQKDVPKDAGPPPAPGPAAHPAVPHPAAPAKAAAPAPAPAGGGAPEQHAPIAGTAVPKSAPAAAPAAAPAPTVASAVAGAGDSQIDGILNGYTPKGAQSTQTIGRIKSMGDIAQGFNGQLDTYIAQGGAVEQGIAGTANFLGVGKDVSAVWANNPYRKVHGILGGIMTGMSAVKNVCGVVGSICGKLGMVLTVIGLLGMIFPPIGAAVSGIARILNVVGLICDSISFVLSGILTGLNGVVLAQQIAAGASAEEKAATADLMMSEANEAASGFVNLAMVFGPKFMKGLLGNSKGIVASLMKQAKATIGRISLKLSANVSHFANKIVRKLGFGGASFERVGGAWKDTGFLASTKEKWVGSKLGKAFTGAPQHLQAVQDKLMAKYGNTGWAKGMDRVGAWGGSVAHKMEKFDLGEQAGRLGEKSGKAVGGAFADTKIGKSMAASAERSELQTRELAMKMESRDAAHLEESRWKNELNRRQAANPDHVREAGAEKKFVAGQGQKVRDEKVEDFQHQERQRDAKDRLEQRRTDRFERRNDEFYDNKTNGITGVGARDEMMAGVHKTREKRYALEAEFKPQETERKELLAKATKTTAEQERLTALNGELRKLDEARRVNKMYETDLSGLASGAERVRAPEYNNWKDVGSNAWEATAPALEMMHLKDQDSAWAMAEKADLKKQTKYNKGTAQANAAGRGGHGTFADIAADARHRELDELTEFVRAAPQTRSVSSSVRGMLSPIINRAPAGAAAPAVDTATQPAAPTHMPTPAPQAVGPGPAHAPGGVTVAPTEHKEGDPVGASIQVAAQVHEPPITAAAPAHDEKKEEPAADEAGGEALPYWPALIPEFDKATHDFGWMRKVAVEFKKAQIDGKQKAVDTLAVYGRYKEYAAARAAAAQKNTASAAQTGQATQQNVSHASQTEGQAGQGEQKQGEAKGAANDKAATDLPEPESRGFWGRILGAVKRWAKNKAAQVFGWIQEKIASVILKGLCGVSMGDMREYAGALRRQQQAAHGVADGAGKTSGQAQQTSIKLSSDATKEAQGAADAIGECDKNIVDADQFMADIGSFEQQLTEEKAHAQMFIASVHAAAEAERTKQQQEAAAHAAEDKKEQDRAAMLGGGTAAPAATPTPAPAPTAEPAAAAPVAGQPASEDNAQDISQIHAASQYVATEAESMTSKLDARADDYTNQLALALTNRTGKGADGVDLKGPAKKESKHIVEEFKEAAQHTKIDMEAFHNMSIDPSQSKRIAEQIITSAQHLEETYNHSEDALDELFARTYNGIKDGRRTLKSRMLDGDNALGAANHAGDAVDNKTIDTALPTMNTAWDTVAKPIQTPAAAPAPAAAPVLMASNDAAPVQRKATGEAAGGDPNAIATAGVQSANERLPHHDQIQASFGRHDVSGIRAQTGGGAAEASRGLGASAYAVGDRVGFAQSPDLHTAAHEAAHVVQQQAGVQLKGGIDGGKDDPHEQHADAVADKVVRGESAEILLDAMGPARADKASSSGPVQRKSVQPAPSHGKADALPAGVPKRGDYIAALRSDKSYEFDFNTFDVHTWSDPVFTAFRYYMSQVFPGTSDAIVRQLAGDLRIGFENHEPVPKEDDLLYAIHIMPSLHMSVVDWMHSHHPELPMQEPKTGGDGLRHADQGAGKGGKKAPPSRINGAGEKAAAGGRAKAESTIGISRELYERLRKAFPEEPIVHSRSVYPELLAYMADNADELKRLQKEKSENALGIEELKKLLDALKKRIESKGGSRDGDLDGHQDGKERGGKEGSKDGDVRESRKGGDTDGSIYGEEGGGKYGWVQFDPKGDIRINPDLKSYVTGASLHADLHWDTSVHPHAADAYLPNHCDYAWTIKHNGKIVDTAGKNHGFIDDRDKGFDVGDDPGVYEITVVATSRHFKSKTYTTTRTITAVSEKVADKNAFDAAHVTGPDATFSRDDKGALHLREGQTPLTVEQEIAVLDQTKGGVDNLATQGKISSSNQETLDEQFAKQRKALLEVQEKTKAGTPYIVRGTFTNREDSSTMPLRVLMSVLQHSNENGEAHYKVLLHDTTFGDAQQHPGSSSHSLEGERLGTVYQMLERESLDDMFEHFHAHNDYPKGTLHLAAQQQMGGGVWEQTRDTNNTRKKFKRILHGVAMAGGAALLIVPGGGVVAAGLMAVTTAAGVGGIALELEDRIAKEGGLKFDRRLMVDVVQLVGIALPFGAMTKTLAEASAVARGRYLLCMASVDAAQGFMIAADVKAQLQLIDANAAVALANAKDDEERKQIIAERDQHVNEVVGGAIVGGGFVLVSLGGGIKQIVATSRAGGAFRVREPVAEIASQGRAKMQDALANDTFPHESEQVKLTDEERSYLEHEVATPEVAKDPHAAKEADKPISERTTQKMPAADPNAKAAESEKPPSERTTQQMPAADPNAKAEAEKAPHERTTQKMPAVDPNANPNGGHVTHVVFSGRGDIIAGAAAKVKPEGGYFDVVVHGDPKQFWVLHDGNWVAVKPNSVRSWLTRGGHYHGGPIRLLSCESGAVADGLAQSFSNGMGVNVKAPTETLWILDDGTLSVGADPAKQTGTWHEFTPYKAATESPRVEANPSPEHIGEGSTHVPAEHAKIDEAAREGSSEPTALGKSRKKSGKGTRGSAETRVLGEPRRTDPLVERANGLSAETPHRAEIVEEAKALESEESAATKDKPLSDDFEQKLQKLEEKISMAEIPAKGITVTAKAKELSERANKLSQKNEKRWELIAEAQNLSGDAELVGGLAKTDMRDLHLVEELKAIKEREEAFELEMVTAEQAEKPAEPTAWKQRVARAKWTNHGNKHAKASSDEEARAFSSKTDDSGKPPSQYLPEVDVPALEREALEKGEPYPNSDLDDPDGTVYVWYDTHRDIGYDNGQLVQTMRVEITSGDVFHGHPRATQ